MTTFVTAAIGGHGTAHQFFFPTAGDAEIVDLVFRDVVARDAGSALDDFLVVKRVAVRAPGGAGMAFRGALDLACPALFEIEDHNPVEIIILETH